MYVDTFSLLPKPSLAPIGMIKNFIARFNQRQDRQYHVQREKTICDISLNGI